MANRKDANQKDIVSALARAGALWIDLTDSRSAGMDGLVLFRGKVFLVEIKDGSKEPSKRKLTDNELKRKGEVESKNVAYNVLESENDALKLIGVTR